MWKGGSEQHFMTPLPWDRRDKRDRRDKLANTKKLIYDYSFVNLTHFTVIDSNSFIRIFTPPVYNRRF